MIKLYGFTLSPFVARVIVALKKKGLDFEQVEVNMGSEEFQKLTPIGKIPVLVDTDGTKVFDSANIVRYLDAKYPDTYTMSGADAKESAITGNVEALTQKISHEILFFIAAEKFNLIDKMKDSGTVFRFKVLNDAEKEEAKADFAKRLQGAKDLPNGQEFFTGQFSSADAAMVTTLHFADLMGFDTSLLKDWKENILAKNPTEFDGVLVSPQMA